MPEVIASWDAREYGGVQLTEVFATVVEEDPAAYPEAPPKIYVILWEILAPARVMVKDVDLPIVALDFVMVDAGIDAVKLTFLVPTSASPLKVVTMMVPLPLVLSVGTYCAKDVGTVHETVSDVVLVVTTPTPLPNEY